LGHFSRQSQIGEEIKKDAKENRFSKLKGCTEGDPDKRLQAPGPRGRMGGSGPLNGKARHDMGPSGDKKLTLYVGITQ